MVKQRRRRRYGRRWGGVTGWAAVGVHCCFRRQDRRHVCREVSQVKRWLPNVMDRPRPRLSRRDRSIRCLGPRIGISCRLCRLVAPRRRLTRHTRSDRRPCFRNRHSCCPRCRVRPWWRLSCRHGLRFRLPRRGQWSSHRLCWRVSPRCRLPPNLMLNWHGRHKRRLCRRAGPRRRLARRARSTCRLSRRARHSRHPRHRFRLRRRLCRRARSSRRRHCRDRHGHRVCRRA